MIRGWALLAMLPAAAFGQSGTLRDYRFFETRDSVFAVEAPDYFRARMPGGDPAYQAAFETIPAYALALAPDGGGAGLEATATRVGALKIYPSARRGMSPYALCLGGGDCAAGGDITARPCEPTACRGLTLERRALKRATRLGPKDLLRPLKLAAAKQQPPPTAPAEPPPDRERERREFLAALQATSQAIAKAEPAATPRAEADGLRDALAMRATPSPRALGVRRPLYAAAGYPILDGETADEAPPAAAALLASEPPGPPRAAGAALATRREERKASRCQRARAYAARLLPGALGFPCSFEELQSLGTGKRPQEARSRKPD